MKEVEENVIVRGRTWKLYTKKATMSHQTLTLYGSGTCLRAEGWMRRKPPLHRTGDGFGVSL
jgi:hypothetical protein